MNRRQPIRRESLKRAAQNRRYRNVLQPAYLAGHLLCELCGEAPSSEVHHKRGRIGPLLTDTDHFIALCRSCHQFAHARPSEAYRLGISERRIGGGAA